MKVRSLELMYLYNTPRKIYWKVIAGPTPDPIQMYDVVFDKHDYKIRHMEFTPTTTT
jgi:hypothetical protein